MKVALPDAPLEYQSLEKSALTGRWRMRHGAWGIAVDRSLMTPYKP